jgi:hypothetical protein
MLAFTLIVLNIVTAYLSSRTAKSRGRSTQAWMWLGMLFGPFAWLTVALLPSVRKDATV